METFWIILIISFFHFISYSFAFNNETTNNNRNSKFFLFSSMVQFANSKCTTDMGEPGLCFTKQACEMKNGIVSMKECAQGWGVCCIFQASCTPEKTLFTVENNQTILTRNSYQYSMQMQMPEEAMAMIKSANQCKYTIPKQVGVCQIKMEFKQFDIDVADKDGNCNGDSMIITGSDNFDNMPLCGHLEKGEHYYLHYGYNSDSIIINFDLNNQSSNYKIIVSMIKCDSEDRAPDGCSQYFTSSTGIVQSPNYNIQQLNGLTYTSCIKSSGSKKCVWSKCNENSPFFISGTNSGLAQSGDECNSADHIIIPGTTETKFCGGQFSTLNAETSLKPFMLFTVFDNSEVPTPSSIMDPNEGCPEGYSCTTQKPCQFLDECKAPNYIASRTDVGNLGFCLKFSKK